MVLSSNSALDNDGAKTALKEPLVAKETEENALRRCTFSQDVAAANPDMVNLSSLLEEAVLQLRKEVPLQLVVNMFQKMVCKI